MTEGRVDAESIERLYQQVRRFEKRFGIGNAELHYDSTDERGSAVWQVRATKTDPAPQRFFHALEWLIHRCVKVGTRAFGMECEVVAYSLWQDERSAMAILRVGGEQFQLRCEKPQDDGADIGWTFEEETPHVGWSEEGKRLTPAQVALAIISA